MLRRIALQNPVDSGESFMINREMLDSDEIYNCYNEGKLNDDPGVVLAMVPPTLTAISFPYLNLRCR